MLWRVGGIYAPGNVVFVSKPFMVPTETLWLDMDDRWSRDKGSKTCDPYFMQCQSYVLVSKQCQSWSKHSSTRTVKNNSQ
jgi:hypothetical protein